MNRVKGQERLVIDLTSGYPVVRSADVESMLGVVWDALHGFRENCIPEGTRAYDDHWGEICTAMAWIKEDLENYYNRDEDTPPDDPHWEAHL